MSINVYIKSVLFKSALCKTPAVILKKRDHVRFGEMLFGEGDGKKWMSFLLLLLFLKKKVQDIANRIL